VQEAANESSRYQRDLWRQKTEEALAAVQEEGVKIYHPDKARFAAKVEQMHLSYAGTPVGDLLKRIKETE